MKPGDRVQLTEAGLDVAERNDRPNQMGWQFFGRVLEGPDAEGLVRVKRDGATKGEVWAADFWELVTINTEAPHE